MFATPLEPEQSLHYTRRENNQHLSQRKLRNDLISAQALPDLPVVCEDTSNSPIVDFVQKSETRPNTCSPGLPSIEEVKRQEQKSKNLYQWFDEYNTHPEKESCKLQDVGSPYILQNSSSNGSPYSPENAHLLARGARAGGSSGEYRSVIDDLTIENKRLRKELRRYKSQTTKQLQNEKLFEIRIHSLPPDKRRELENTLSSFTSSLNSPNGERGPNPDTSQNGNWSQKLPQSPAKVSSTSNTRNSQVQESSFILTTNSTNPTSITQDAPSIGRPKYFENNLTSNHSQSKSPVENVSEIPSTCRLKNLTKTQKKKLVVQRLEQLFTGGRGSIIGETSNPWNQQDISSSLENQSENPLAGAREANMGPSKNELVSQPFETASELGVRTLSDESEYSSLDPAVSDQRPTRPLDLDPDRAQVPSDNLDYIRHLGLSTPKLASDESTDNSNEKGRWVYLNLLINMAQLHMINVTADFVRSAIKDDSRNFQLSEDGQMLLWKGGNKASSPESDESSCTSSDNEYMKYLSPDPNVAQESEKEPNNQYDPDFAIIPNGSLSGFQYKPLVYRKASSESLSQSDSLLSRSTLNQSLSSLNPLYQSQRSNNHIISNERKLYEEGSMIFYSGVNFYIDLSGDRDSSLFLLSNHISDEDDDQNSSVESLASDRAFNKLDSQHISQRFEGIPLSPIQEDNIKDLEATSEQGEGLSLDEFSLGEFHADIEQISRPLQKFKTCGTYGTRSFDHFAIRVSTCRYTARNSKSNFFPFGSNYIRPDFMRRILRTCQDDPHEKSQNFSKNGTSLLKEKNLVQSLSLPQPTSFCRDFPVQTKIISLEALELPPSTLLS
ncbi:Frequency clock protein [Golovinomyces cichoracearum]|uniref:Frequency clock protein n=1 Tax=Golovinomyces cichoracearum TaxID=62708 RepID=A0A420IPK7_9PEZI|nr:Frequency clock protein [Golovinomyces cichoracearum]